MTPAEFIATRAPIFAWIGILNRADLTSAASGVGIAAALHLPIDLDRPCTASISTLAKLAKVDDRDARRALPELVGAGLARVVYRPGTSPEIWAVIPPTIDPVAPDLRQRASRKRSLAKAKASATPGTASPRDSAPSPPGTASPGSDATHPRDADPPHPRDSVPGTPGTASPPNVSERDLNVRTSDARASEDGPGTTERPSDPARGPESISSTGTESESQAPATPEPPTMHATDPDDAPDLGPMISTVGAPLAERAAALWGPTFAAELGARIHAVRADRQTHTRARSLVMRALDARIDEPPADLERILPPAGAPEFVAGEDAQKATLRNLSRTLAGAPSRPAVTETAPPAGNGAQKPPPLDRRPVLERFAEQPESVKRRWLDDVDRVSGGALVGVAREAAAANRWDKAQSQPRVATSAGRLSGAAGRA